MPRPRSEMRRIREVLRLYAAMGNNISAIAQGGGMSRSTVREYLKRAAAAGIDAVSADTMTDEALEAALFGAPDEPKRPLPDWAKLDEELRKHKHVTRKLLWLEYKADHPDGYEFSQFKVLLKAWQKDAGRGLSMRQVHRAGEAVEVDYAGDKVTIMDQGVERDVNIFIACLPCSGLIYAEGSFSQGADDWLSSHVRLFRFLGGVPAKVTPDILIDRRYVYSVPHALAHKDVDAFLTPSLVQVYHRGERVASHPRLSGPERVSTLAEHMPPAHAAIVRRTPDWVRDEAAKIGVSTGEYVERLLTGRDHIEQGVRSCLGVLRLAGKYPDRIEAACQRALVAGARSSAFVEDLLKHGRPLPEAIADESGRQHANLHPPGTYH